eukprot:1879774-Rhodomonas_salina.1
MKINVYTDKNLHRVVAGGWNLQALAGVLVLSPHPPPSYPPSAFVTAAFDARKWAVSRGEGGDAGGSDHRGGCEA